MSNQITRSRGPRKLALVALVATLALLTGGCEMLGLGGGDSAQQAQKAQKQDQQEQKDQQQAQQQQQAEAEKAAEAELEEEYERPEYPGNTRRNPFMPNLDVMKPQQQVAEGEVRPLEPLEQYAVSALELVAIISETAVPKAMFVDPEGFGHVVKEGDRVGRNGGQITDIRDNEVEIRETTDEEDSQTRFKTVELRTQELQVRDDTGLSDAEREALRQLLETEEGRRALEESRQNRAPGANASERESGGSGSSDGRFGGIRPPTSQGQ
ncbi:MAG: pilus assembly protein PilP [Myxococcota bacterium]